MEEIRGAQEKMGNISDKTFLSPDFETYKEDVMEDDGAWT